MTAAMVKEDVADHRPAAYKEGDTWVLRASTFGACDASIVREALGQQPLPPPKVILDAYAKGVQHEEAIVKGLSTYGWVPMTPRRCGDYGKVDGTGQLVCDLKVGPRVVVRCHPDAIAQCFRGKLHAPEGYRVQDRRYVEAKCLARGTRDPLARRQYAWQASIEAAATGLRGVMAVGWKDDEGGLAEVEPIFLDTPPHSIAEVKARARHLVRLIEAGTRGEVPACDWPMWPCGFYTVHDTSEGSVHYKAPVAALDDERERDAKLAVARWRTAVKMRESWAAKEAAEREKLQVLLADAGVTSWQGLGATVTYYAPTVQKRFDKRAAKADGVDVDKYMTEVPVHAHVKMRDDTKATSNGAGNGAGGHDADMAAG